MRTIDLTGKKFGKLTVIQRSKSITYPSGGKSIVYLCRCECGNEVMVLAGNLRQGHTTSCGCVRDEVRRVTHTKHGASSHRLHNIWTNIKQRCYNPLNADYKNYGERGISVCEEWRNDFRVFYNWAMANGYADDLTIDRVNVNGNYEPTNCRWATRLEQRHNRRDTIKREGA